MVLFFVDKKGLRKKEKGHFVGLHDTLYRLPQYLPFKMAAEWSWTTTLTCKVFLVVNHPEITLTLEKCLIQGKIIACFPCIERFLWIMQFLLMFSSYQTSFLQKRRAYGWKLIAELWRAKRACGAPWVSKSTHPRKFGNHVTVHRPPVRPHHRATNVHSS